MRNTFIDEVMAQAENDPRIVVISGDTGNHMFDRFSASFPGRFLNAGIAEANMTGVAAGMAMAGLRPFTYAIASFSPGRCLEQIRLDVCQHGLPVVVVGAGAGLSYAALGPTHHALEDIAWLRVIPGMTILCPGDPLEVRAAVRAALRHDGPVYLRLGKKGEPVVHDVVPDAGIGDAIKIRTGGDAAILAVGTMLPEALAAVEMLAEKGVAAALYSLYSIKPLDTRLLSQLFASNGVGVVAVAEEHAVAGGAGSAVAEWLADQGGGHVPLLRFGTGEAFLHEAGGQGWLRGRVGLTAEAMTKAILVKLGN